MIRTVVLAAVVAAGLVACGDDSSGTTTAATSAGGTTTTPSTSGTTGTTGTAAAGELQLTGGSTTLELASGVSTVLNTAGIDVSAVDPATDANPGIQFPVAGGTVTTSPVGGTIDHEGALQFSAAGQSVELADPQIDLGAMQLTAEVGGQRIPILNLRNVDPQVTDNGIMISAAAGVLTQQAAGSLNDVLSVSVFDRGLGLGQVTVDAQG